MRLLPEEKIGVIKMVTTSEIGVNRTLRELGIQKSTFYKWYNLYLERRDLLLPLLVAGGSGTASRNRKRIWW